MKANYAIEAGDVRVIRPFVYLRETQTRDFSVAAKLPIINENCPACFEQPKVRYPTVSPSSEAFRHASWLLQERARVKQVLAQEESMIPALFYNLRKALMPLMHDDSYKAMAAVARTIEKNGCKNNSRATGNVLVSLRLVLDIPAMMMI